jgi:hypothetical protein
VSISKDKFLSSYYRNSTERNWYTIFPSKSSSVTYKAIYLFLKTNSCIAIYECQTSYFNKADILIKKDWRYQRVTRTYKLKRTNNKITTKRTKRETVMRKTQHWKQKIEHHVPNQCGSDVRYTWRVDLLLHSWHKQWCNYEII